MVTLWGTQVNSSAYTAKFFENESFLVADISFFCSCLRLYYKEISVFRDFTIL